MLVVASIEHTVEAEILITDIVDLGISKENIMVKALEKVPPSEIAGNPEIYYKGTNYSFFDLALAFGTAFSVIGAIYGYVLDWGPIIWGIIGFSIGAILAFFLHRTFNKGSKHIKDYDTSEVLIFVECEQSQHRPLKELFMNYRSNGLAVLVK
jgi:hypothetical protein